METIVIDEEFKGLLPALDDKTFELLESNLLENGCRDPLVLWGDILIDGHNRYAICQKNNIPFKTVNKEFASRENALIWIINTQMSRRNLSPLHLIYCRGRHYRAERKLKGMYDRSAMDKHNTQNGDYGDLTVSRLAAQYKVSKNTIGRDGKASEGVDAINEVSPDAKRMILAGDAKIDKKVLEKITSMPKEDIEALALAIENGTYERPKPEQAAPGIDSPYIDSPYISSPNMSPPYGNASDPNGSYVDPEFYATQPDGSRSLESAFNLITDGFHLSQLQKHSRSNDTAEFKTALHSYIVMLEDLYRQL